MRILWHVVLFLVLLVLTRPIFSAERYALVIGITGYPKFDEEDRLRFADDDAREFAAFLKTAEGGSFPPSNIRLLVNGRADRDGIYREMNWLGDRVASDDLVYVFFAGHGMEDRRADRAYFMPFDASSLEPEARGIRADRFIEDLKDKISARKMIFFIDACHAGASVSVEGLTRRGYGNITPSLKSWWDERLKNTGELNMSFFSAAANQRSWEDEDLGHGLFAWYLLQGLKTLRADRDGDCRITAGELRRYLLDSVELRARRKGRRQSPFVSPAFDPDFVLAYHPGCTEPSSTLGSSGILVDPQTGQTLSSDTGVVAGEEAFEKRKKEYAACVARAEERRKTCIDRYYIVNDTRKCGVAFYRESKRCYKKVTGQVVKEN